MIIAKKYLYNQLPVLFTIGYNADYSTDKGYHNIKIRVWYTNQNGETECAMNTTSDDIDIETYSTPVIAVNAEIYNSSIKYAIFEERGSAWDILYRKSICNYNPFNESAEKHDEDTEAIYTDAAALDYDNRLKTICTLVPDNFYLLHNRKFEIRCYTPGIISADGTEELPPADYRNLWAQALALSVGNSNLESYDSNVYNFCQSAIDIGGVFNGNSFGNDMSYRDPLESPYDEMFPSLQVFNILLKDTRGYRVCAVAEREVDGETTVVYLLGWLGLVDCFETLGTLTYDRIPSNTYGMLGGNSNVLYLKLTEDEINNMVNGGGFFYIPITNFVVTDPEQLVENLTQSSINYKYISSTFLSQNTNVWTLLPKNQLRFYTDNSTSSYSYVNAYNAENTQSSVDVDGHIRTVKMYK